MPIKHNTLIDQLLPPPLEFFGRKLRDSVEDVGCLSSLDENVGDV